jgi:hypothetical protein
MFLPRITWSSPAEAIAAESHNSVSKHVVTNWDGLDDKAFADFRNQTGFAVWIENCYQRILSNTYSGLGTHLMVSLIVM